MIHDVRRRRSQIVSTFPIPRIVLLHAITLQILLNLNLLLLLRKSNILQPHPTLPITLLIHLLHLHTHSHLHTIQPTLKSLDVSLLIAD